MENKEFKPYIPAEKITPELTVTSIVMGVLLAVIGVFAGSLFLAGKLGFDFMKKEDILLH